MTRSDYFVAKLDFGVSKEQLTQLFEEYGRVTKVNIPTDKETGKPRGFAFVEMPDADEANNAISALDGFEINRRRLAVKIAENRNDNKKPKIDPHLIQIKDANPIIQLKRIIKMRKKLGNFHRQTIINLKTEKSHQRVKEKL